MEDQNGRNHHQYRAGQGHEPQISAHYNSSAFSSAGRFRTPQLPQQNTARTRAQPLAHSLYLGDGRLVSSSLSDPSLHGGTTSLDLTYQSSYGTYQQSSTSPSFGTAEFFYGYQQIPRVSNPHHYTTHNMPSLSMSSRYGMPQAPQAYSSSTASYHSLSSPTAGPSMYDPVPIDHQAFQMSDFVASQNRNDYTSQRQTQQQTMRQENNPDLRELFEQYQMRTREIFTLVRDCNLEPTASLLLQISRFLIGNVEALGLDQDDRSQYEDRLRLWDTFNQCWLTVLHLQHKTTQIMTRTGQQLPTGQSILNSNNLKVLGQEIVKLCDSIEKTGLVDYQMGVAEERIIDLLLKCLDVLGPQSPNTPKASGSGTSAMMQIDSAHCL